jgi:hypothetical protein
MALYSGTTMTIEIRYIFKQRADFKPVEGFDKQITWIEFGLYLGVEYHIYLSSY